MNELPHDRPLATALMLIDGFEPQPHGSFRARGGGYSQARQRLASVHVTYAPASRARATWMVEITTIIDESTLVEARRAGWNRVTWRAENRGLPETASRHAAPRLSVDGDPTSHVADEDRQDGLVWQATFVSATPDPLVLTGFGLQPEAIMVHRGHTRSLPFGLRTAATPEQGSG